MDKNVVKKIEMFFSQFKQQNYKDGEILIRADDDPSGVFYLTNGVIRMYEISKKGDELVLNIFKPGSFFPMNWVINDTQNRYYYETVGASEVLKAPKEETLQFIKENPDVLFSLMSRIYKGIDGLLLRMGYLMTGSAHDRLITELLIQANRFGKKDDINSQRTIKISETDLAAQAGLTRETISREMKRLKEKELLSFNKGIIIIKDITKLEAELNLP